MRYYAKQGEIPEVRDLKKHQVVPLNSKQGTYLKVIRHPFELLKKPVCMWLTINHVVVVQRV